MSVKIRIGYVCFISFFIICLISLTAHAGADFNGLAGVSVGYDNNASLSQEEKNSAFVSYRAKLGFHIIPQNAAYESDIFAEAIYRDYFTLEDNYRMKASGYMTWHTAGGLMFPGIFAELSSYRDGLNPADEKDGVLVGGKLDWLASARITLGIQQVLSWQNYINSAEWYAHRDNPSPLPRISAMLFQPPSSSPSLPMSISAPPAAENHRNEMLRATTLRCIVYLSSELRSEAFWEYIRSDFSIAPESYIEKGIGLSLVWTPIESWEITPSAYWKRFDYDNVSGDFPDNTERQDTEREIGLNISYFFKKVEVFAKIDIIDNHSDFGTESYRRTITQCGINWSF